MAAGWPVTSSHRIGGIYAVVGDNSVNILWAVNDLLSNYHCTLLCRAMTDESMLNMCCRSRDSSDSNRA